MFIIQCPILWYAKVCALPSAVLVSSLFSECLTDHQDSSRQWDGWRNWTWVFPNLSWILSASRTGKIATKKRLERRIGRMKTAAEGRGLLLPRCYFTDRVKAFARPNDPSADKITRVFETRRMTSIFKMFVSRLERSTSKEILESVRSSDRLHVSGFFFVLRYTRIGSCSCSSRRGHADPGWPFGRISPLPGRLSTRPDRYVAVGRFQRAPSHQYTVADWRAEAGCHRVLMLAYILSVFL